MSGRNDITVAQAVWPWRRAAETPGSGEDAAARRKRAAIEGVGMACIGGLLLRFAHGHWKIAGWIALTMAALTLLGGLAVPPLYRAIKRGGGMLAKGVGVACSWLLLAPFFYLVFPAARLALALRGKDPLHRRFDPTLATYWSRRPPPADAERYRRQF